RPTHCGSCPTACAFASAGAACTAGVCGLGTCNAGYRNCDAIAANGCETNTDASVNNCGACGTVSSIPTATAVCAGAVCTIGTCNAVCHACGGACVSNTNIASCGT